MIPGAPGMFNVPIHDHAIFIPTSQTASVFGTIPAYA
jgi:hypothetical protein